MTVSEFVSGANGLENSKVVATIPTTSLSYYHSFGQSENYIVFPEMPLVFNPWKFIVATVVRNAYSDCMDWHPNIKVIWLNRNGFLFQFLSN